jgi:hypothetical protein
MKQKTLDVCECGDYRHQHEDDWRGCTICVEHDPMNGRKCLMFRSALTATLYWTPA